MSRIPKNNINTPFLHIMIQGNNKNLILQNEKDKEKYLKILKDTKEEIDIQILAYCIMGNHVHLLFYEKNINNVIRFMHKSNLLYAKYYNFKYDRVGYVFRDRYKVQPIMSEKHLITCINYIHKNPVKGGLCSNMNEYRYSSFNTNIFIGKSKMELKIKKYIEITKNIKCDEEFVLMECEDKEEICKNQIEKFLCENNLTLDNIKENEKQLAKLIEYLSKIHNISYRMMEKYLNINREKLRRIVLKNKNIK